MLMLIFASLNPFWASVRRRSENPTEFDSGLPLSQKRQRAIAQKRDRAAKIVTQNAEKSTTRGAKHIPNNEEMNRPIILVPILAAVLGRRWLGFGMRTNYLCL